MLQETKSTLATAFAVIAIIAALASATASAITAVSLSNQIQQQRFEAVVTNCREVNRRHDNTVRTLTILVAEARKKASPQRAAQLKQSIASTTLLIDALAPKRADCVAYANKITRP